MSESFTGGRLIAKCLRNAGVDSVFELPARESGYP